MSPPTGIRAVAMSADASPARVQCAAPAPFAMNTMTADGSSEAGSPVHPNEAASASTASRRYAIEIIQALSEKVFAEPKLASVAPIIQQD